jgi:hypothetical protein
MKFIDIADIDLDSPLVSLAAYKDAPADVLHTITRDAFRLVDTTIEESVNFITSAGKNLPHRETHAQA